MDGRFIKNNIKRIVFAVIGGVFLSLFFYNFVKAIPPLSPYLPGETLDPSCSPGDPNCTVLPSLTGTSTAGNISFYTGTTTLLGDTQLFWDNTNKRLGVGTSTPVYKLDVAGNLRVIGQTIFGGVAYTWPSSAGSSGQVLTTDGTGNLSWTSAAGGVSGGGILNYLARWTASTTLGNSIIYDDGTNVGIGTTAPSEKLHIIGNALITGTGTFQSSPLTIGNLVLSHTGLTAPRTFTFPDVSDTLVSLTATQTLTNKALGAGSVWNGNVIGTSYGGTGLSSIGAANQILGVNAGGTGLEYKNITSLLTAGTGISITGTTNATIANTGVLSLNSATGTLTLQGTTNQVNVSTVGSTITLSTPQDIHTGASPTFAGLTLSSLTPGSVLFAGTGGTISQNNPKFFWDNTNLRLGIGTSTPAGILHVATGTTNALVVDNAGNVGIGTTTLPPAGLYVEGGPLWTSWGFRANIISGSPTNNHAIGLLDARANPATAGGWAFGAGGTDISLYRMPVPLGNTSTAPYRIWRSGASHLGLIIFYQATIGSYGWGSPGTAKLEVIAGPSHSGAFRVVRGSADEGNYITNAGELFYVGRDGNVGIGTTTPSYKLDVQGQIRQTFTTNCGTLGADAAGAIYCPISSLRYKTNIQDLNFDINKFLALNPRSFDWNTSTINFVPGEKGSIGFIAEEVNTVFPELVRYKDGQPEGIKYELLPVYLFKIVKDLILGFTDKVKASLNELGIIIENGVAKIKEIFTEKITTKQICLEGDDGETICLDKNQVKELLNRSGGSYTIHGSNGSNTDNTDNNNNPQESVSNPQESVGTNTTSTSENNTSNPQESVSNQNDQNNSPQTDTNSDTNINSSGN
jgi:hypothetical protein